MSNEIYEPIHVHVSKGNPCANATKVWLTKGGGCFIANNNSRIPEHDLRKIYKSIRYNFFFIVNKWKQRFKDCEIKFYC